MLNVLVLTLYSFAIGGPFVLNVDVIMFGGVEIQFLIPRNLLQNIKKCDNIVATE